MKRGTRSSFIPTSSGVSAPRPVRASRGGAHGDSERHERVCFEASEYGEFLPSNVALEFTVQYQSAIVFGRMRVLEDVEEKRRALYGLIGKYYPTLTVGKEYRPITDQELKRTSVYAITIESWSGIFE